MILNPCFQKQSSGEKFFAFEHKSNLAVKDLAM